MTARSGRFIVAIGLALQMASPAPAAEPMSFGVLTAPPYGLEGPNDAVSGSNRDIGALIAAKVGLTFTYRLEPLARLVSDLKVGKLDLMIMFPTDETRPFAVAEIMPNSTVVLPKPGSSFQQFADLKGKTIASLRGAVYDKQFTADESIERYPVDSYLIGLRMTKGGRVDGMIGPDFGLYYQIAVAGMKRDEFGPPLVLNTRMLVLLASKAVPPEVVARLKVATDELRASGAIDATANKYVN